MFCESLGEAGVLFAPVRLTCVNHSSRKQKLKTSTSLLCEFTRIGHELQLVSHLSHQKPRSVHRCFTSKHWNRIDCKHSGKRSKTHKRSKECFLIGQNRTKHAHFWGSHLFQATYNLKTEKQTINSTCLVSARRLVEGINCFSVFTLYVAWKRGLPQKFARFVPFFPIKKRSL